MNSLVPPVAAFAYLVVAGSFAYVHCDFPTTLQGPFPPFTAMLNNNTVLRSIIDLPESDPRLQSTVEPLHPEQISLALSSSYDSVWISWITGEYQIGSDDSPLDPESVPTVVKYGITGTPLDSEATGYSLVYTDYLQNYTSGIIHHVRLTDLEPGEMYEYKCGDSQLPAMSEPLFFTTMPVSTPQTYPRRIAIVGDLGLSYNTSTTFTHLLANHPNLLVLIGGLSYSDMYTSDGFPANSSCNTYQSYQPRWDYWGRFMQPLIAQVPTMMVAGKHEIEKQEDGSTRPSVAYTSRFSVPYQESGSLSPLFYSFNAGGVHFIVLNPYTPFDSSSEQYKWLKEDLAGVNRSETPWVGAAWYAPWYSTFSARYREAECMRVEMEELVYESHVDIVFNAHVHAYERSNRVYNYTLDECGPVYITVGSGGAAEDISIGHVDDRESCPDPASVVDDVIEELCPVKIEFGEESFCADRQPDYSAYRETSFGYGTLEVKNETHALWSWNRNEDTFGISADVIFIVREPGKCGVE